MKKFWYVLILIIISISCEKHDETNDKKYETKILSGNNQTGYNNQELDSTIVIFVTKADGSPYESARFEVKTNDGKLLPDLNHHDGNYPYRWFLGCNLGIQNACIYVYDSLNILIDTLNIESNCIKDTIWNRACGLPLVTSSGEFVFPTVNRIIEHPNGFLYIITHSFSQGLFCSTDNGASWTKTYSDYNKDMIREIKIEFGIFYYSSDDGLYNSVDGVNWNRILDKRVSHFFVLDNKTIFADWSRSNDEGKTWTSFSIQYAKRNGILENSGYILNMQRVDENRIILLNDNGDLLFSKDNGLTWAILDNTNTFWCITDFFVEGENVFLINLYGSSLPQIHKASLNDLNWSLFCTLTRWPGNIYEVTETQSYKSNFYILTDNGIYRVNPIGDTLNITRDAIKKTGRIDRFIISKDGYLIACSEYLGDGIFYRKLTTN